MNCPYCKKDVPNTLFQYEEHDFIDEWTDGDEQLNTCYTVLCPHCHESFNWIEVWKLKSKIIENADTGEYTIYEEDE